MAMALRRPRARITGVDTAVFIVFPPLHGDDHFERRGASVSAMSSSFFTKHTG